eukprot:2480195-Amphidinium_carterae.2
MAGQNANASRGPILKLVAALGGAYGRLSKFCFPWWGTSHGNFELENTWWHKFQQATTKDTSSSNMTVVYIRESQQQANRPPPEDKNRQAQTSKYEQSKD